MSSGWEGLGALGMLMRLRARAKVRGFKASLRRPARVLLFLFLGAMIALVLVGQFQGGDGGGFVGSQAERWIGLLVSFLLVVSILGAVSNGIIAFTPAEVQFLFPAPLSTRALLASFLATGVLRCLSGSLLFSLFLRPWSTPIPQALAGYFLYFITLLLLGLLVDLAFVRMAPARRKRLGRGLGLGALLVVVAVFFGPSFLGAPLDLERLQWLAIPGRPWTALLLADEPGEVGRAFAVCLAVPAVLALGPLLYRGNIRESAMHTSEEIQRRLARLSKGDLERADRPTRKGRTLPMLPRWGGAGVHMWRQLSSLSRRTKSYTLLVILAVFTGGVVGYQTEHQPFDVAATVIVVLLTISGPLYVQCDFRSDFDSLALLRSLPTSSTALAAGQMLASAAVIYAFQLALGGWILFTTERHVVGWVLAFLAMPLVNLVQLCVENGVFLLYPHRIDYARGPPGALEMARMYAVMLAKFVVLGLSLVLVFLPAFLVAVYLEQMVLGIALGFGLLLLEVVLLVWAVGRVFLRIDPGRDLVGD